MVLKMFVQEGEDHVVVCAMVSDPVGLQGCPGYALRCSLERPWGKPKSRSAVGRS